MKSIIDTAKEIKEIDQKFLLGLVFIALIVSFIFSIFFIFKPNNPQKSRQTIITPTKFILNNSIRTISPLNQSTNISPYASVSARFANPVYEQGGISLILKPAISGNIGWSLDNTTIIFSPKESFVPSTTYEATLTFPSGKQVWQFTIISSDKVNNEDALRNQIESDIKTAESLKDFYIKYPWWDRFPIKKDRYFVYFNPERKIFIGLLYPRTGPKTSVDQEVSVMKNEIEASIRNLGINIAEFGIDWKIKPEP